MCASVPVSVRVCACISLLGCGVACSLLHWRRGGDYDLLKALSTVVAMDRVKKEVAVGGTSQGSATAEWIERMMNVHGNELEGDMQVGAADRYGYALARDCSTYVL
jgi:hypothetical protein